MTLTLEQKDRIYEGIPSTLWAGRDRVVLQKARTRQFVNQPEFPLLLVTFVTEGIPVTERRELKSEFDESTRLKTTTYGQISRARVSALIESPDQRQIELLAGLFSQELYRTELCINPLDDRMQFRGCDPPQFPEPYETHLVMNGKKGLAKIYRCAIDFFVEYWFTWTMIFETMQQFDVKIGRPPISFSGHGNGTIYLPYTIDVILS